MRRFDIGNPASWSHVLVGSKLVFEAKTVRKVRVSVNATERVTCWVADNEDMDNATLVGAGDGLLELQWSATGNTYLEVRSSAGAAIYVRGHAPSHTRPPSDAASYVNLAPRGRPSELHRMMYIMKLNEIARDEKLQAEIQRLRSIPAIPKTPPVETEVVQGGEAALDNGGEGATE